MSDNEKQYTEAQGLYLQSFFESAGEVSPVFEKKARELFGEYGLDTVQSDEYYPGDDVSNAFFDVVNNVGEKTMREGGIQMGQDVPWPEGVDSPHAGLQTINAVHQEAVRVATDAPEDVNLAHPGGRYTYDRTGARSAHVGVTERYPYPNVMAEGVFLGIVKGHGADSPDISETTPTAEEQTAWEIEW